MVFQIKAMDSEQEDLQFLGFFGIFKESIKIILTWSKIFIQIILAFILPNSCLFLANNWISNLLFSKINHNLSTLNNINQIGSPTYNNISNSLSKEWANYWLIKAVYFIFSMILSLLTISAVVYTVACIYTGKEIAFRKVISVVPKVWKRLMITFLCNFCIMVAYMVVLSLVIIIPIFFFYKPGGGHQVWLAIMVLIIVLLLILGFFYMTMIWQLANVVSVMEKNYGFKALIRSKELIKGKMGTAFGILLVINLCAMPILGLIERLDGFGLGERICFGILSLVLWALFSLFGLVVHTVFYLVCKSYHHESIDKSSLADHLDVYLGEYVPLKAEVQLEHLQV